MTGPVKNRRQGFMNAEKICENVLLPLESSIRASGAGYVEVLTGDKNAFKTAFQKSLIADFPRLSSETLFKNIDFKKISTPEYSQQQSAYEKNVQCSIYPVASSGASAGFFIVQGLSPLNDQWRDFMQGLAGVLGNFLGSPAAEAASAPPAPEKRGAGTDDKFHNALMNIRDIQAKLFPSFDNISEFDIRSAYLPAEIMSGTFIDGLPVGKGAYILVACDVSDYGPASLFAGAAIRAMIRSGEIQTMIPSMIITEIDAKLRNLPMGGNPANIHLSICRADLKTGKVVISAYGPITALFYTAKKRGLIDLGSTEAGRLFAKRTFFRDLSITLDPGDTLLYYSRGVTQARGEGDEEYGLSRLKAKIFENAEGESLELVHAITESVYEFTDYNPVREDIILISMKKL